MLKKLLFLLFLLASINIFSQDLTLIRDMSGKYGFIDKFGDTIIECKYDYAEPFSSGLALIKNNLRYKVIDTTGKLHDLKDYDGTPLYRHDMGEYHSGLPVIIKQWDCAYISSAGDVFLTVPYNDACSFEGGKAKVFEGGRYTYISKNGFILNSWMPIEDNYHTIKNNDNKFGYIDKNGALVIDYQFIGARDFDGEYAQISNGNYWTLIDKKGERFCDWYEIIEPFDGELAVVKKLGNIGFINKTGKFMGEWYKTVKPLDYGLYRVEKYLKFAIVNNEGYLVTQWFENVYEFKDGYLKVKNEGKYAYLNKIGALVIGWYDTISEVKEDVIRIKNENKEAFYNVEKYQLSEFYDFVGEFHEGIAIVKNGQKYGFINKLAKVIIPIEYDKVSDFDGGIAQVEKGNKAAYINTTGDIVMGWYDKKIYFFKEPPRGLIVVNIANKYGFQTINGRRVIPAKYDYAENFVDGLALVKSTPTKMFIDKQGNLVPKTLKPDLTNLRLDLGYGHSEKPIEITVWKCAFIDYNGDVVLNLDEFTDAFSFVGDKAKVIKGDKFSYINRKGKIIDEWYDLPDDYHADFKNGKFGYINKNGEMAIDYKFNEATDFVDGKAKVRIGDRTTGKYGIINIKGVFVTKMYDEITNYFDNIMKVRLAQKYSLVDTAGKEICGWYDKIYPISELYSKVELGGKFTYINIKGKQFDRWFEEGGDFYCGRVKVKMNEKWGYIDTKGELVISPIYDNVWNFENNISKVEKEGKFAFIDLTGRLITDWFERIYLFSEDRAVIVKDGKWGYIDVTGKIVIKPVYDRAFAFSNGEAIVVTNGQMLKIDKDGNIIPEVSNQ